MKMLDNNKTSLTLIRDSKSENQTKHIDVIYHYIRGLGKDGELPIEWIKGSVIYADGLTKTLLIRSFKKHQDGWSLVG